MVPRPPSSRRGRPAAFLLALAVLAAVVVPAAVAAAQRAAGARPFAAPPRDPDRFLDVRIAIRDAGRANPGAPGFARPSKKTTAAREALSRRLGSQAVVEVDPLSGTVESLQKLNGALSGPTGGSPSSVARDFVRDHATALGLSNADVDALDAAGRVRGPGGLSVVRFRQAVDGIPSFDSGLRVGLDRVNRVISVTGAPRTDLEQVDTSPSLDAATARDHFADDLGVRATGRVSSVSPGARRTTSFSNGDDANLVIFSGRDPHLAWHLTYTQDSTHVWDGVVDATTGQTLYRANLVKFAVDARVFKNYPGAAQGGAQDLVDIGPYLSSSTITAGPNVHAFADLNDNDLVDAGEETDPDAGGPDPDATNNGTYAFNGNNLATGGCDPSPLCSWDHRPPGNNWALNKNQSVIQTFWFANKFHDHLASGPIGFTPASGNFEGDDPVIVNALDGADPPGVSATPDSNHRNNANMLTPKDGTSPRMQMYLFSHGDFGGVFRDIDGGDDAAILYHEYTHGLSSRLVTNDDGTQALNSAHAGAMGEAWSDWYAQDFLVRQGLETDDPAIPGEISMGRYTDAVDNSIRFEPIDCPVGAPSGPCPGGVDADLNGQPDTGPGGFTFGDFGKIAGGPEVHSDGEIWAQTLWDLRAALISAAGGDIDAGSDKAEEIITNGMRLSPPEPSFLDMRNAILAATTAAGVNRTLVWDVFKTRGMGYYAAANDSSDVAVVEDFSGPPAADAPKGTIAGTVTSADSGLPIQNVSVGIAGHATDPNPDFGDYLAGTSAANGTYSIAGVPQGTYPKLVFKGAAGFDQVTNTQVGVTGGQTSTQNAALRRDWAASAGGATVATNDNSGAPYGCGKDAAIDQSQGTGWSAMNPGAGTAPYIRIKLPQTIDVSAFGVDPGNTCGDDWTASTKDYKIETSPDDVSWTVARQGSFAASDAGQLKTLTPTAGATNVRYVRVTLLSPQRANVGPPRDDGADWIDLTEFEVFGGPKNVLPAGSLTATPSTITAGGTVQLDASSFTDPDSLITGYDWDLDGNGTVDRSTPTPTTSFTYGSAGTYTPTVQANDFRGGSSAASTTVTVNAPFTTLPGDNNPPVVEPPVVKQKARLSLSRHTRRGRATFKVVCKDRCKVGATLTISNRLRRKVHNSVRTVGRIKARPILGTVKVTITLTKRARRHFRKYRVRRFKVVLRVTAAVVGGERTVRKKTVTLRV